MRSQVQVLAGPPPIVTGQSAAGSEPGTLAVGLGRAGAARPSPPAPPLAPPGPPTRPSGSATTTHRGRAPSPMTAATRRLPRPAPNPAARVRHRTPTDQRDVGSLARVLASATVDRAVDGSAATGASTGSGGHGRPATSTWSPRHRLSGRRRTRPDRRGQTADGWTPHGWTADGWTLDGWTAAVRPPDALDDDPR